MWTLELPASPLVGVAGVSRETEAQLVTFVALLEKWQAAKNLIADGTLAEVWQRHVADSAELVRIAPDAERWLDLGSGAGFPGLVVAILLGGRGVVHLVESNGRKAAFLRAAAREASIGNAVVHNTRVEDVVAGWSGALDAISARAFASLDKILALTAPLTELGVPLFLHKGTGFARERETAAAEWGFDLVEHRSRIGDGLIAEVRQIQPRRQR